MRNVSDENVVFVLGVSECFGEMSIYGVFTEKKLVEAYNFIASGKNGCFPDSNHKRDIIIYRFPLNEFIGEISEWNACSL